MKEQKIIVKPILEDKFWIVEDSGVRIGTLSKDNDTYVYSSKGKVSLYANESQLTKKFGKNFLTAKIIKLTAIIVILMLTGIQLDQIRITACMIYLESYHYSPKVPKAQAFTVQGTIWLNLMLIGFGVFVLN